MTALRRAAFLDRDGTLIEDANYLADADRVQLLPGATEVVQLLNMFDVLVIVVTNQSGIAQGLLTEGQYFATRDRLNHLMRQAGADVNARILDVTSLTGRIARTNTMTDRQGQTALHLAADLGRAPVVKYLLEHGATTDLKDDAGKTPLDVAQARGEAGATRDEARTKEIVALLKGGA